MPLAVQFTEAAKFEPEVIELAPSAEGGKEGIGNAVSDEGIELLALPMRISEDKAHEILNKNRKISE